MKYIIVFIFTLSISIYSQVKFSGRVLNSESQPISGVNVKVKNQNIGTRTDANGSFSLSLQKGKYQIEFFSLNYENRLLEIEIDNDQVKREIILESKAKNLKGVTIKTSKNKESEQAILAEQKQQVVIQEKMGAQEMSKKGASDAQAAVVKMAGISKEEGTSQIYVRGLGDRYNTTTLNGLFLPSDNPEFKNISLEYFPIEVIQNIGVSKTFNSNLLGDFAGASIDITTKDYFGKPFLNFGVKGGVNTNAMSNKSYGSEVSYLGNVGTQDLPTLIEGKFVDRNWQPKLRTEQRVNSELNLNGSWSTKIGKDARLSFFGTATHSNKYQYFNGLTRMIYASGGDFQNFNKTTYGYIVNQNAMANIVFSVSNTFKTKINALGFRTAANQVNEYVGFMNGINENVFRRRMINDISNLYVIQSITEWKYNDKLSFLLSGSANFISNIQPNRLTTSLVINQDGTYRFLANNSGDHSSYYQKLEDEDYSVNIAGKYKIKQNKDLGMDQLVLNFGYMFRQKYRYFEQSDYVYRPSAGLNNGINPDGIDQAFSQTNFSNGLFTMEDENPRNGKIDRNNYNGDMTVQSPSVSLDYAVTKNTSVNIGTRIDIIDQLVYWNISSTYPNKGSVTYSEFKFLPFINFKHAVNDQQNLKMAFSKTYTLPQFKELAPFLYFDISTYNTRGNPYLYASDNYNLDVKYEWFPSKNELVSLAGFGKFIQNPINKVFEASAGADQMVFVNSGELAMVFGVELEVKKSLIEKMGDQNNFKYSLTGGFNVSALYSRQDLNKDKITKENKGYTSAIFTNTVSGLQGASPLIFNVDLTYKMKFEKYQPQFTLVFNYFLDRLYSIGAQGAGDVYEASVPSFDFISKHSVNEKLSFSFNIRNILNPKIERFQEVPGKDNVLISSFKRGMDWSFGLNYNF